VLKNSRKNDTIDVLNKIDEFCRSTWMMNIGPEKGEIIKRVGIKNTTNKIL
jgi:hypothetical protein